MAPDRQARVKNPKDPSWSYFAELRRPSLTESERTQAFGHLLQLDSGWWGDGPLMAFARGAARALARHIGASASLSIDQLDWEGSAQEALMLLAKHATRIKGSPRAWLYGTIKNHIRSQKRRILPELTAEELDERSDQHGIEGAAASEEVPEAEDVWVKSVRSAIADLDPSLRDVAEALFLRGMSRAEIRDQLPSVSEVALRKRIQRAREILQARLGHFLK